MLSRVVHAPLSFFDSNPLGRILNRFSTDVAVANIPSPGPVQAFLRGKSQRILVGLDERIIGFPLTLRVSLPNLLYHRGFHAAASSLENCNPLLPRCSPFSASTRSSSLLSTVSPLYEPIREKTSSNPRT